MEAVVTTDWHLDSLSNIFRDNAEYGNSLLIKNIKKPLDYAVENGIKNVIVPGDLGKYDTLSSSAEYLLMKLLLEYDGIVNIHIMPGNHDYTRLEVHNLKLIELLFSQSKFKSIHFYSKPTLVTIDKEKFYFLPYPYTEGRKDAINIAHLEPAGAVRDNGKPVKGGLDLSDGYWIIGHIHKYQSMKNFLIPGTLNQNNFGESLPKGFVHIKVVNNKVKHKYIKIDPSFTFNTLDIESKEDWGKISKKETDFYRLYIRNNLNIPDYIYEYSNVIQVSGKIQDRSNEEGEPIEDKKIADENPEQMTEYLVEKYAFNKAQVKRTLKLIELAKKVVR